MLFSSMILQVSLGLIYNWTFITSIFSRLATMHCGCVSCKGGLSSKLFSTNVTGVFPQFQMCNIIVNVQVALVDIGFCARYAVKLLQKLVMSNSIVSLQLLVS